MGHFARAWAEGQAKGKLLLRDGSLRLFSLSMNVLTFNDVPHAGRHHHGPVGATDH